MIDVKCTLGGYEAEGEEVIAWGRPVEIMIRSTEDPAVVRITVGTLTILAKAADLLAAIKNAANTNRFE